MAQLAGVPALTIARATQLLNTLNVDTGHNELPEAPQDQLGLFATTPHPVIELLQTLDLNDMTPMEAFDALRRLTEQAKEN